MRKLWMEMVHNSRYILLPQTSNCNCIPTVSETAIPLCTSSWKGWERIFPLEWFHLICTTVIKSRIERELLFIALILNLKFISSHYRFYAALKMVSKLFCSTEDYEIFKPLSSQHWNIGKHSLDVLERDKALRNQKEMAANARSCWMLQKGSNRKLIRFINISQSV